MSQYCRDLPSTKLSCRKSLVRVPTYLRLLLITRVGLHPIILHPCSMPCHATPLNILHWANLRRLERCVCRSDTNVPRLRLPFFDRVSALSCRYVLYSPPLIDALIHVRKNGINSCSIFPLFPPSLHNQPCDSRFHLPNLFGPRPSSSFFPP